jgi:hypothetical protein
LFTIKSKTFAPDLTKEFEKGSNSTTLANRRDTKLAEKQQLTCQKVISQNSQPPTNNNQLDGSDVCTPTKKKKSSKFLPY